jgi:DNA-binding GntR family transcriptional regulator
MGRRIQSNHAYRELRRKLLTFEIPPKTRIRETLWASKLGVSRTSIRESLTRLEGDGLVTRGEKGGYFTFELSNKDLQEIRQIREILETSAFSLACDQNSPEILKELREACRDFSNFYRKGYFNGACEADLRFHQLIMKASGNLRLLDVYERSNIPLFHMKIGNNPEHLSDYQGTEKEHALILKALEKGARAEGIKLLKQHFLRGEKSSQAAKSS